jgi:hypothetical protein
MTWLQRRPALLTEDYDWLRADCEYHEPDGTVYEVTAG